MPLPSLFSNVDVRAAGLPPQLSAYAAGALFALAASPCSTPVLASILAYASTQVQWGQTGSVCVCVCGCCALVIQLESMSGCRQVGAGRRKCDLRARVASASAMCWGFITDVLLPYCAVLQESPFAGGLLLFLYSCGYVAPLLVAATATVSAVLCGARLLLTGCCIMRQDTTCTCN